MTRAEIAQAKYDKAYKKKVCSLANNHFKGLGGRKKAREFIEQYVDKPCFYCGKIVSIYDIEVDHKVPMTRKIDTYTPEEKAILTADNNVTGCHKACNRAKGSLDYNEYEKLLIHLQNWIDDIERDKVVVSHVKAYNLSPHLGSVQYILTKLKAAALKYYGGKK